MKKKLLLLLLPLTLTMVSCGKDVGANLNKVDLARLLNDEEIAEALEKVKDNFADKLSGCEVNVAVLETDLVNEKSEMSGTASYKIKGDEYAEAKIETTTKVTKDFYSYSDKETVNEKVAAFGKYYLSYQEETKDGQKDTKEEHFSYEEKGDQSISDVIVGLPFSESQINMATIGVDRSNNIYMTYFSEAITSKEGHDQNGKDCVFKDKTTYEISGKFGNLKDPKMESYKIVRKVEANYDEELKIYSKYQVLQSYVSSYKFEYKNRGKNDGKDSFIDSLPEKSISNAQVGAAVYEVSGSDYTRLGTFMITPSSSKSDFSSGNLTLKASRVDIEKDWAFTFLDQYTEVKIDKSAKEITPESKNHSTVNLNPHGDFDIVDTAAYGKLYRLKDGLSDGFYNFKFELSSSALNVSII